jgi:hypothetical protein
VGFAFVDLLYYPPAFINCVVGIPASSRGRWWDRLSIDLAHLDRPVDACASCLDALDDPCVAGGDRITLQRRLTRLSRRHGAAATAKRRQRGIVSSSPRAVGSSPSDSTADNAFLDTLKAIAMSSVVDRVSSGGHLPKYISPVKGWVGGVRGEETIVGNPTNRVTGEKSRFIGKDLGSEAVVADPAAKRRERVSGGSLPSQNADECDAGFVNVTTSVMDAVDRDGKATVAHLSADSNRKQTLAATAPELDIDVDMDSIVASSTTSSDTLVTVEEYALQHYQAKAGWSGQHCEGGVFHALFGILMWEVRGAPVTFLACELGFGRTDASPCVYRSFLPR